MEPNQNSQKPENPVNNPVAPIRTYKSDVAEFIKSEGKTLADIAIAENSRRSNVLTEQNLEADKRKKLFYTILAVIMLVGLSTLLFWFILSPKQEPVVTPSGAIPKSMFVSGIKEKTISIGNQTSNEVFETVDKTLKESSPFLVLQLISQNTAGATTLLTAEEFFDEIGIYPPGDLVRSLTDSFAVGSIGGKARFLVLKNSYYGGAFAGMLGWENTIVNDLKDLLGLPTPKNSNIATETIGTTTFLSQIRPSKFTDGVIANRDARIFKDGAGTTILIYLFPDNNTIVITGSENTAKIVVDKLLRTSSK